MQLQLLFATVVILELIFPHSGMIDTHPRLYLAFLPPARGVAPRWRQRDYLPFDPTLLFLRQVLVQAVVYSVTLRCVAVPVYTTIHVAFAHGLDSLCRFSGCVRQYLPPRTVLHTASVVYVPETLATRCLGLMPPLHYTTWTTFRGWAALRIVGPVCSGACTDYYATPRLRLLNVRR